MGVGIGVLAQPQLIVRFMTVKSNREINRGVISGGIFILMMTGVAFVVGALSNVYFYNTTGKIALVAAGGNDKIIPAFIQGFTPSWYAVLFMLALVAAAMSTLSSQFHTMGSAVGRDLYQKALNGSGNPLFITRTGVLVGILLSVILAFLAAKLDVSMQIIATGTALFFGLCAASFLPAYVAALYVKKISKKAVIVGMISGFVVGVFWIFFVHEKQASSLQICNLLLGKVSLFKETSWAKLGLVDPIVISLPISSIVTAILGFTSKADISEEHVEKCFKGI
jgi:SSS family solute:Na+ symporter